MKQHSTPRPRGPVISVVRGVWRLGHGDAGGFNDFRSGPEALLSAMAPNLALFIIILCAQMMRGPSVLVLSEVFLMLACLLARLLITHALAVRWSRQGLWTRYAAASLWCDWLPGILSGVASGLLHGFAPGIGDTRGGAMGVFLVCQMYDLWLGWFVARKGLVLGRGQAALVVGAILAMTCMFGVVARILPPHYNLWQELSTPLFHG